MLVCVRITRYLPAGAVSIDVVVARNNRERFVPGVPWIRLGGPRALCVHVLDPAECGRPRFYRDDGKEEASPLRPSIGHFPLSYKTARLTAYTYAVG